MKSFFQWLENQQSPDWIHTKHLAADQIKIQLQYLLHKKLHIKPLFHGVENYTLFQAHGSYPCRIPLIDINLIVSFHCYNPENYTAQLKVSADSAIGDSFAYDIPMYEREKSFGSNFTVKEVIAFFREQVEKCKFNDILEGHLTEEQTKDAIEVLISPLEHFNQEDFNMLRRKLKGAHPTYRALALSWLQDQRLPAKVRDWVEVYFQLKDDKASLPEDD